MLVPAARRCQVLRKSRGASHPCTFVGPGGMAAKRRDVQVQRHSSHLAHLFSLPLLYQWLLRLNRLLLLVAALVHTRILTSKGFARNVLPIVPG